MQQDRIFIEGLTVLASIGVYDWEQQIKQRLVLDLELAWDIQPAAKSDDVTYCLDYAQVSELVIAHIRSHHFALIERVAEEVAQLLFKHFPIPYLRIKVSKPGAVAAANNVAVQITRYREQA